MAEENTKRVTENEDPTSQDARQGSLGGGAQGGELEGRDRGMQDGGGKHGNDLLEDGQLRGVDEEGNHTTGTHGGPKKRGSDRP